MIESSVEWRVFQIPEIIPRLSSVLRLMGVPEHAREREGEKLKEIHEEAVELFISLARPRGAFRLCNPGKEKEELFFDSFESPILERFLEADFAAVFLVTLGAGPEEKAAELMSQGEYLLASILDSMASEGAENMARKMQKDVEQRFKIPACVRFSPGYGSWSLDCQRFLLPSLQAREHGVSLTESLMMVPRKSISGVILPKQEKKVDSLCKLCQLSTCSHPGK